MESQRGIYKFMMRSMCRTIKAKAESNEATDSELKMLDLLEKGGDFVDKKYLLPVIDWINGGCPKPESHSHDFGI